MIRTVLKNGKPIVIYDKCNRLYSHYYTKLLRKKLGYWK